MTRLEVTTIATPLGPFTMVAGDQGVMSAGFAVSADDLGRRLRRPLQASGVVERRDLGVLSAAVERYFDGELDAISGIPLAQLGTPFQQAAWATLRRIPAGQTMSYGQLAVSIRRGSARAAGTACARNPVTLLVPCHRVVRSGGELGGYLWGVDRKRWLLDHERRSA